MPHPQFDEFAVLCGELEKAAVGFAGLGFRFATLKYGTSADLLSGKGAKLTGGRVNARDTFPVIYTSTDPQTATAETFQNFAAFGFPANQVRPRVFVGVEIKLSAVLDLTDRQILRRLGLTLRDLAQPWWPVQEAGSEALTQAIGRAAYHAGFEAVMLPSVRRKGGANLNVFPEKLRPGSHVAVVAEKDLNEYLK